MVTSTGPDDMMMRKPRELKTSANDNNEILTGLRQEEEGGAFLLPGEARKSRT